MQIKQITDENFREECLSASSRQNQRFWNQFVGENSSPASFLQSWQWGEFRSQELKEKVLRLAIYENNELVSLSQFFQLSLPLGRCYLFCPRGPIISRQVASGKWQKIINLIISEIKKIAKREKIIFVRFGPPYDKSCQLPITNYQLPKILTHSKNPENTLLLNLSKSEDEILKAMHQKTRYNIRLAERKGIIVKIQDTRNKKQVITNNQDTITKKDIDTFYIFLEQTAKRDKIKIFDKSYYQNLLEYFSKLPITNYQLQITLFTAEYKNKPLASIIILGFGNTAVYLHGASSNEYRNLMPNYLIQWQAIKWAKENGYKFYDFWGVEKLKAGDGRREAGSWSGISRFKRGFTGELTGKEINYAGTFDLVLDKMWYNLYRVGKFVKR